MNKASSLVLSWRGKVRIANQFWRLAEYESFAASEVALYAFLINERNKFHWQMPFSCPTFHVCNRLRMSKQTLVTARERLAKRKLINFTNGTTRFQPSKYSLLELTEDLSVYLTEDMTLNNKEVDKDKEVINQCTHEEQSLLPIEELEEALSTDMEWQEKVKEYLSAKNMVASSTDMATLLAQFFRYLHASGVNRKTEEDTKRHFVNWICKQGNCKSSVSPRKNTSHPGLILTDDSLDKYNPVEQWR